MTCFKNQTGLTFITKPQAKNGLTSGVQPLKGLLEQFMSQTGNEREVLALFRRLVVAVEGIEKNTMPDNLTVDDGANMSNWDNDDPDRVPDWYTGDKK